MFHFRKRPNDTKKTKHKKLRAVSHEELRTKPEESPMKLPYLLELNPGQSQQQVSLEIVVSPLVHRNSCVIIWTPRKGYTHLSVDILWFRFTDGSDNPKGKVYRLSMNYTEVGSDPSMAIKVSTRVYGDVIETTLTKILVMSLRQPSFIKSLVLKIIFFDDFI